MSRNFFIIKNDGSLILYTNKDLSEHFKSVDREIVDKFFNNKHKYLINSNIVDYINSDETLSEQFINYINDVIEYEELEDGLKLIMKL